MFNLFTKKQYWFWFSELSQLADFCLFVNLSKNL